MESAFSDSDEEDDGKWGGNNGGWAVNNSFNFSQSLIGNGNGTESGLPPINGGGGGWGGGGGQTDLEADTPRITDSTDHELDDAGDANGSSNTTSGTTTTYSSYAAAAQNSTAQKSTATGQVQFLKHQNSYYAPPVSTHTPRLVSTDEDEVTWELDAAQPLGWECYQFQGGDTTVAKIYPGYQASNTQIAIGDKVIAISGEHVETALEVNQALFNVQWAANGNGTRPVEVTFLVPEDE